MNQQISFGHSTIAIANFVAKKTVPLSYHQIAHSPISLCLGPKFILVPSPFPSIFAFSFLPPNSRCVFLFPLKSHIFFVYLSWMTINRNSPKHGFSKERMTRTNEWRRTHSRSLINSNVFSAFTFGVV